MSQTDLNVANATGAAVRADINAHLDALVTLSSGPSAPSTTFANQWWADTSTNLLKRRNNANTAFISVMSLTTGLIIGTDVLAPGGDGSGLTNLTLVANSVGPSQIATDAVGSDEIAANAVNSSEIAANAVGTSELSLIIPSQAEVEAGTSTTVRLITAQRIAQAIAAQSNPHGVLIEEQTASGSPTIDFTTGLDATYDVYELHVIELVSGTDDVQLFLRYEVGGAFKAGATDYAYNASSVAGSESSAGSSRILLVGGSNKLGNSTGEALDGIITLFGPASTVRYKKVDFSIAYDNSAGGSPQNFTGVGRYDGGVQAVTGLQLLLSSGNIATGTFRLYGINKS